MRDGPSSAQTFMSLCSGATTARREQSSKSSYRIKKPLRKPLSLHHEPHPSVHARPEGREHDGRHPPRRRPVLHGRQGARCARAQHAHRGRAGRDPGGAPDARVVPVVAPSHSPVRRGPAGHRDVRRRGPVPLDQQLQVVRRQSALHAAATSLFGMHKYGEWVEEIGAQCCSARRPLA